MRHVGREPLGAMAAVRAVDAPAGLDDDPFGLDDGFRRDVLPLFRFLHDRYWRVEVTGAQHIPRSGGALLIANHSGAIPFAGTMIVAAAELHRGRTLCFLFVRFVVVLVLVVAFFLSFFL